MGLEFKKSGRLLIVSWCALAFVACGRPRTKTADAPLREPLKDVAFSSAASDAAANTEPACQIVSAFFAYDSFALDENARDALGSDARCLRRVPAASVRIVGLTDPRGTEEYNLALGERRANEAARYLRALGVANVQPTSAGEELAQGENEAGWARDRRVDLTPR